MSRKKMILKLLTVIVGTVIAAFGLDIAIYAGFGSATLTVLWQGMAKTIRITISHSLYEYYEPIIKRLPAA